MPGEAYYPGYQFGGETVLDTAKDFERLLYTWRADNSGQGTSEVSSASRASIQSILKI